MKIDSHEDDDLLLLFHRPDLLRKATSERRAKGRALRATPITPLSHFGPAKFLISVESLFDGAHLDRLRAQRVCLTGLNQLKNHANRCSTDLRLSGLFAGLSKSNLPGTDNSRRSKSKRQTYWSGSAWKTVLCPSRKSTSCKSF